MKTRNRSDNLTERDTLQNRDEGTARQASIANGPHCLGIPAYACFGDLGSRVGRGCCVPNATFTSLRYLYLFIQYESYCMLLEVRHIASVFKFDLTRQRPRLLWDSKSQKPLRFKVNSSQPKNPGGSLWLCSKCFTAASMHDLLYRTPTSYYGTRYAVPLCTVETQRKSPVWILCLFRIVRPFFCRKGITCESHAISSARRWV
jgi:hypothetical protein